MKIDACITEKLLFYKLIASSRYPLNVMQIKINIT